jgi:hypothetical protein
VNFGGKEPAFAGAIGRQMPDLFDSAASGTPIGAGATRIGLVEDVLGHAWIYGFVAAGVPGGTLQVLQGSASGLFETSDVFATALDPVSGLSVAKFLVPVVGLFARVDYVNPGAPTTLALVAKSRGVH